MKVIGVDTGGTFTDVIALENGRLDAYKLSSTPGHFETAVLNGARAVNPDNTPFDFVHSSTVATNALLERKGARVALIGTRGFRDLLFLGRQNRPDLYALHPQAPQPWVEREHCFEVTERVTAEGRVLQELDDAELTALVDELRAADVEAVAVCLLFSFLRPEHEQRVGNALEALGIPIVLSHELLPEFREFERCSTTVANAYVLPVMRRYLDLLEREAKRLGSQTLRIVQSNGGALGPTRAGTEAARTLLSGPAAGMIGALTLAHAGGEQAEANMKLITFDMGGTSTDVSLVEGTTRISTELELEGFPIRLPMVDVHTVGAGGGSIAFVDAGGALQVGPESAGADPGPAFYGSSSRVTVSDANLCLTRLHPEHFLGGRMALDLENSAAAMEALAGQLDQSPEATAQDILRLVNANMERAIRVISVERGYDLRDFTLLGFGGAGGLHVFDLADALDMSEVLIPGFAGVLSALGAAVSPLKMDASQTRMLSADDEHWTALLSAADVLKDKLRLQVESDGFASAAAEFSCSVETRYRGQSHELTVPLTASREQSLDAFHTLHQKRFGHSDLRHPVEWVTLRCSVMLPAPAFQIRSLPTRPEGKVLEVRNACVSRDDLFFGDRLLGPVTILESYTTTRVPEGWMVVVDRVGNLRGTRKGPLDD